MTTNQLSELRELVARLHALLDDPQPGLWSWTMAVHARLSEIAAFHRQQEAAMARTMTCQAPHVGVSAGGRCWLYPNGTPHAKGG